MLERLGRDQARHRRAAAAAKAKAEKLAQAQAEAANAQRDNLRDGKGGRRRGTGTDDDGLVARHARCRPRQGDALGGVDKITVILSGSGEKPEAAAQLGGPDDKLLAEADRKSTTPLTQGVTAALSPDRRRRRRGPRARFLHEAHAAACRIFGTTLGPEANEEHRNHFHVDMAERKYKKICD